LRFAVPAGLVSGVVVLVSYLLARDEVGAPPASECLVQTEGSTTVTNVICWQPSTAATISLLFTAFWILVVLSRPFKPWKALLVGSMVAIAALAFITPLGQSFFNFSLTPATLWTSLAVGAVGALGIEIIYRPEPAMRAAAAVNRPSGAAAAEEVMHRFIRGQLGILYRIPWWIKPLLPSFVAAVSWMALTILLVDLDLLPVTQSARALRGQAGAFALAAVLSWKWLLIVIFLVHLMNLYVYLGTHPIWPYLSETARKLLLPLSFLRVGKFDLSPVVGIAVVYLTCDWIIKPLVIDLFRRNIV
jgi:hypothetical protein